MQTIAEKRVQSIQFDKKFNIGWEVSAEIYGTKMLLEGVIGK